VSEIELHVAEVYFDRLIERVEAGETIAIARDGVRVALVVPAASWARAKTSGVARGGGATADRRR
jgi:antitoxin (DNA-binding transcriptional repressor) of toxin-antitoxin stability system